MCLFAVLDTFSVTSSLAVLVAISLPPGYLTVNTFQNRRISGLPFFSILPLYLAVGITVQIMFSFLIGTIIISAFVPLSISVGSLAILLFLNVYKKNGNHYHLLSIHDLFSKDQRFGNIFSLIVIVVLFVSFARIPIATQWPPVGDAIFHSMLTSLAIYNGHVPTDLRPIESFPFPYPSGYHVFSADLSYIFNFNSGEAIFILATYLTALISALLFTLTYVLTKSYWMSLPIPFSILVVHSTEHLDRWIAGYLGNGPYPNLFAFMAVISVIILAQISYNRREAISKIATILLIVSIALFVTYPQFVFHILVFIAVYWMAQIFEAGSTLKSRVNQNKFRKAVSGNSFISYLYRLRSHFFTGNYERNTENVEIKTSALVTTTTVLNSPGKVLVLATCIIVLASFIIVSEVGGLFPFYYRLLTFNLGDIAQHSDDYYLNANIVMKDLLSDHLYAALLVLAVVSSIMTMILKKNMSPVIAGFLALIAAILAGLNLIYPLRTGALVSTLAWPIIAYNLSEFIRITKVQRINLLRYIIILSFVAISFYFEMPHILYQAAEARSLSWWLTGTDVHGLYDLAGWLQNNVKLQDLILNDRAYSGFYLDAFTLFNLTHNYWTGNIYPKATELMPDASMIREMNHLQNKQYLLHRVPLPAAGQPIKNDFANNKNSGLTLSYDRKPYIFLSGSNYTDISTAGNNKQLQLINFSVGTWFKTNSNFSSDAFIVNKGGCCSEKPAENMNYGIWMTKDEKISAGFETSNGTDHFVTSGRSYNDGKWHYAVTTNDGFEVKLYIDGALVDRRLTSGAIPDRSDLHPIRIGAKLLSIGEKKNKEAFEGYFTGNVYDIRIWNRPLVAKQMQQELSKVWLYPYNRDLVYSLLKKFDVKYILINSEIGFKDYVPWGGSGNYLFKPYYNEVYENIFNSYDFLRLRWKAGDAAIYSVNTSR